MEGRLPIENFGPRGIVVWYRTKPGEVRVGLSEPLPEDAPEDTYEAPLIMKKASSPYSQHPQSSTYAGFAGDLNLHHTSLGKPASLRMQMSTRYDDYTTTLLIKAYEGEVVVSHFPARRTRRPRLVLELEMDAPLEGDGLMWKNFAPTAAGEPLSLLRYHLTC